MMGPQERRITSSRDIFTGPSEREQLANVLKALRLHDHSGKYPVNQISRGVERVYLGVSDKSYNQIHGVDFYSELDGFLERKRGIVRVLDVGCGLGYFLKDLQDHAVTRGLGKRVDVHGVTLTRVFKAFDERTDYNTPKEYTPVVDKSRVHIAHGENMPFSKKTFDMVVSTLGPHSKYGGIPDEMLRRMSLLEELFRVTAKGGIIYLEYKHFRPEFSSEALALELFLKKHKTARLHKHSDDYSRIQITRQ
jgi:SAM-dependent methyltransferase